MLVAAAVCPAPPLLVPEVASGAADDPELVRLRSACYDAVGVLAAARPERLVVVGPAEQPEATSAHPPGCTGSFRRYGVERFVTLGVEPAVGHPQDVEADALPPSLSVAAWLLERTGWSAAPVRGLAVAESLTGEDAARTGRELVAADRLALLVMGDGSARRTLKAPGYLDERAEPFDAEVARALGHADPAALLALDATRAAELMAAGRPAWQVLAGAAHGADLQGDLLYDAAPYGVGYLVATWV